MEATTVAVATASKEEPEADTVVVVVGVRNMVAREEVTMAVDRVVEITEEDRVVVTMAVAKEEVIMAVAKEVVATAAKAASSINVMEDRAGRVEEEAKVVATTTISPVQLMYIFPFPFHSLPLQNQQPPIPSLPRS